MKPQEPCCNLCGGSRFKIREKAEEPFKVLQCLDCGLVFVHPLPDPAGLAAHYDERYYRDWIGAQKEKRTEMWENRLNGLEESSPGGRLLDVGCGDGAFLRLAQKRGWTVSGTEYSSYAARYSGKILGTGVFNGELFDAAYPGASFDAVTMWHVLEHVADPLRYLKEVRRILKPSGLLLLAVPNVNDLLMKAAYALARFKRYRLFSKNDREPHLYHFSPETIKAYLEAAGLRCLRLGPDNGIVERGKKIINAAASVPYHLFGIKIFNAIEAYAVKKQDRPCS
ncbi:MAG: class I SAM-dependent methyltransferase [Elusimicrobiales bacterium]|jgi:2-polyprenyl-3-methyl-5-hydroxy-6-metoxy-1,4-benzoquinol methylase